MDEQIVHYRLHHDPKSSHQQIARLVRRLGASPLLDVGAAQGVLGQLVGKEGLTLDAVEPNPAWAEHAKPFYRQVFASTIEEAALQPGSYRAVVFLKPHFQLNELTASIRLVADLPPPAAG